MKTFEIQKYQKGNWVHDSYFETGEDAVSQAKHMAGTGKHDGIRVVEDEFNEGNAVSKAKLLFVDRPSNAAQPAPAKARQTYRRPPQEVERAVSPRGAARVKTKSSSNLYVIIGTLVALIIIGLAAHYGLQFAFK